MDMTQCKKGDKLLLRNGEIATMINSSKTVLIYPYIIDINGVLSSI